MAFEQTIQTTQQTLVHMSRVVGIRCLVIQRFKSYEWRYKAMLHTNDAMMDVDENEVSFEGCLKPIFLVPSRQNNALTFPSFQSVICEQFATLRIVFKTRSFATRKVYQKFDGQKLGKLDSKDWPAGDPRWCPCGVQFYSKLAPRISVLSFENRRRNSSSFSNREQRWNWDKRRYVSLCRTHVHSLIIAYHVTSRNAANLIGLKTSVKSKTNCEIAQSR